MDYSGKACVQGRTQIEKMYRDRFARAGLAHSTKINSKRLIVDNDLAYESGYGEIGVLKDGAAVKDELKFAYVLIDHSIGSCVGVGIARHRIVE